jgi:beta-glucosidase
VGFDGVVVADWDGIGQLVHQGVAADLRDAAAQAIVAGVDSDMVSGAYSAHLAELLEAGKVPLDLVDDAARRVIRLKLRQGLFEDPYVAATSSVTEPPLQSRLLAREAAAASFVLLTNNGNLPLTPNSGRVPLTGPFARDGPAVLGTWTLDGRGEDVASSTAAISARLGEDAIVDDGASATGHCIWPADRDHRGPGG